MHGKYFCQGFFEKSNFLLFLSECFSFETMRSASFFIEAICFLDFFIKLSMLIQKRETISVVSLFSGHQGTGANAV